VNRRILLAVGAVTLLGFLLRLHLYGQSLNGDELSTLWIVENNGLGGVVDVVSSDAEITPPLNFVLSWLATRLGSAPELIRLPALIAGTASIPLVYLLGSWTVSRRAGLAGAALFAISAPMTYYGANGRAYALLILLLLGSTLAMLRASRGGGGGWWAGYAALSAAAMYTHYTAAFVLIAQLGWLLVFQPAARLRALAWNAAAAVLFLPWLPGLRDDLDSPTTQVLQALQGTGFTAKRLGIEQWLIGHPRVDPTVIPGNAVLVVACAGLLFAALAAAFALRRGRAMIAPDRPVPHGLSLLIALALATPVLEGLLTLLGTDLLGAQNLTASWYGVAAAAGALVTLPGGVATIVSAVLVFGAFGAAQLKLRGDDGATADFRGSAELIDREAAPGDVVVDMFSALVTPVPLTPLDVYLEQDLPQYPLNLPDGPPPFLALTPPIPPPEAELRKAFRRAEGHKVFFVVPKELSVEESRTARRPSLVGYSVVLPAGARIVGEREFPSYHSSSVYEVETPSAAAP